MILLGKNPGMVQTHTNVFLAEEREEYFLAVSLQKSNIKNVVISKPVPLILKEIPSNMMSTSSSTSISSIGSDIHANAEKDGLLYIA